VEIKFKKHPHISIIPISPFLTQKIVAKMSKVVYNKKEEIV
jgi:hypothetical protein